MGYCVNLEEYKFKIKKENAQSIVEILRTDLPEIKGEYWSNKKIYESNNILVLFQGIGYALKQDENGDYVLDYFCGDKLTDDEKIFDLIAQYVEPNSYFEFTGEDNAVFRLNFTDGQCLKDFIEYGDEEDEEDEE